MSRIFESLEILTDKDKENLDLPTISVEENTLNDRKVYIESYGCAMNFADSEIVASILKKEGFSTTSNINAAELILLNTCAIRDNAEQKVRNRLVHINPLKKKNPSIKIGILGCMAERLKTKLLEEEKFVDMVVGPDSYRDIPNLIEQVEGGQKAVNVFLSREETYADISPIRLDSNGVTAFISIMRGCDNMCSFCVVPYTRGRERSRDAVSIVNEAQDLFDKGYREVTLLGQNVDSYKWTNANQEHVSFADLLILVSKVNPDLRVRFSTSHPKDITDDVLYAIKNHENICNYVHLPAQSGSSRILENMNRNYSREWYLDKITKIKEILGEDCGVSSDKIVGFCSETEEDFLETMSLVETVQFDYQFMFTYSERPNTPAAKKYSDDIPEAVKSRRLQDLIDLQRGISLKRNEMMIGKEEKILIEGFSKKSNDFLHGRTSNNKMVIIPKGKLAKGQYVSVKITDCSSGSLKGIVL
jgi:tRNA-2-methylthio-N6-dimethylallyladenosine synthase